MNDTTVALTPFSRHTRVTCADHEFIRETQGPRLVTAAAGWRSAALSRAWWTYTLGPMMGAIAGGYLYDYTLGAKSIRDVIGDGAASSSGGSGGGSSTSTSTSTASTTSMKTEV